MKTASHDHMTPQIQSGSSEQEEEELLTSRSCTRAFTFLEVSGEGELWDASLMSVARKFLHFFTFSCIS